MESGNLFIELLRKTSPGAIQLATLVSLAARIEPELLRAMRLRHLPKVDAGAEADLWFSPLVQASSPLGLVLRPEVLKELRKDLAKTENRTLLNGAWETLQQVHESVPDAVRLEERVTYLSLSGASQETIGESLLPAVAALAKQNNERAVRWARRVLPRLPAKAQKTEAAKILDVKAARQLGKQFLLGNHPPDLIQLVNWLAPGDTEQVQVGVHLIENRRGARWEFSHPPSDNSHVIQAPMRDPIVLEIKWEAHQETRRVLLPLNNYVTVPHHGSAITIRSGLNKSYVAKPPLPQEPERDQPPATRRPGTDFLEVAGSVVPGLILRNVLRVHTGEIRGISWSRDGYLASLFSDQTIRIWDTSRGEVMNSFPVHTDEINSVAWSPDGHWIASASDEALIHLQNADSGNLTLTLEGHSATVNSVAWSPNGNYLASASNDGTVDLRDGATGDHIQTLSGHTDTVNSVAWSPDSRLLASASNDGNVSLWGAVNGQLMRTLSEHLDTVNSVVWSPDGRWIASGSNDKTICIWEAASGRVLRVLEGHSDSILCVDFSANGRWLASKSADNTIRLWRCDTGMCMTVWDELATDNLAAKLAFHPNLPMLATLGEEDTVIRIWELNETLLLGQQQESVHYTTAKIVLVGDSGVGKTGLGWRLAHNEFRMHSSTHSQQFWNMPQLGFTRADGTECEAILWDLAGQPMYRQIHSTWLENVTAALVLFDPTNRQEPFRGVQFWLEQLRGKGRLPPTVLVGGRVDVGSPAISQQELEQFCERNDIRGGYISTSAKTNEGLEALIERLKQLIPWDEMPATVTTITFKRVKDYVLSLKERPDRKGVLVSPIGLREQLHATDRARTFTDAEVITAVGHLETHGFVAILRSAAGEQHILLTPELLVTLASSIVLLANSQPVELGSISETQLFQGKFKFDELEGLTTDESHILLDATILRFLEHNTCFRETLNDETLLVFPNLIKQKRPLQDDVLFTDDTSYMVRGRVQNLYASLVVLLGNMPSFTRANQWRNQAQYEMGEDEICGFRVIEETPGELEIVLYYGDQIPQHRRTRFQELFEHVLYKRDVEVTRFPPVVCVNGHRQNRDIVIKREREGKHFVHCQECGARTEIPSFDRPQTFGINASPWLQREEAAARLRSSYEVELTKVKAYRRDWPVPRCYVSHVKEEFEGPKKLIKDLRDAGVYVMDQAERVQPDDFVIAFRSGVFSVPTDDPPLITRRRNKKRVIQLTLTDQSGTHEFENCETQSFSDETHYPISLFNLVLTLYAIPLTHAGFAPLRRSLHMQWEQTLPHKTDDDDDVFMS